MKIEDNELAERLATLSKPEVSWKTRLFSILQVKKVSRQTVAAELGVSEAAISLWLNGPNNVTAENLVKLCRLLEIRPDWLMMGELPIDRSQNATPQKSQFDQTLEKLIAEFLTARLSRDARSLGEAFLAASKYANCPGWEFALITATSALEAHFAEHSGAASQHDSVSA